MADPAAASGSPGPRGCLAAGAGATALAVLAPFMVAIRSWRAWRRGSDVRSILDVGPVTSATGVELRRIDMSLDVPLSAEVDFRRRWTDSVVRVAETLRREDDVYHLVYRLPWDPEPLAMAVGPQLQQLGERFSLVQSQGVMEGRTAVWLSIARNRALSELVDPTVYDPEVDGEPDGLLMHPEVRWSMATAWVRTGPSLIIRAILIVPEERSARAEAVLERLR